MTRQYICDSTGAVHDGYGNKVGQVEQISTFKAKITITETTSAQAVALDELRLLREACDVGAVLSRRIKDASGRIRHVEDIVDDVIKLLEVK